jgi:hypothetical protein
MIRLIVVALAAAVLTQLAPVATAAPPATATAYAVVAPEGPYAKIVLTCEGAGGPTGSRTVVTCRIYDSSGGASISRSRSWTGSRGYCVVQTNQLVLPIEYCADVVVTNLDTTQHPASDCHVIGDTAPPHNAPPSGANILVCLDPAGTGI